MLENVFFGFKMWRDAYKNIFPEKVFIDRESKIEEKVKKFDNKMQNSEKSIAYIATYDDEFEEDFVKLGIGYLGVFYTYDLQKRLNKHM